MLGEHPFLKAKIKNKKQKRQSTKQKGYGFASGSSKMLMQKLAKDFATEVTEITEKNIVYKMKSMIQGFQYTKALAEAGSAVWTGKVEYTEKKQEQRQLLDGAARLV